LGLAKNSLGTFISKVAIFLLRFPIGILIARYVGPEGKGVLYVLFVSITMAVAIGNLGLGPASIYFIGKDKRRFSVMVGNLLMIVSIVSVIVTVAGWIFLQQMRSDIYVKFPLWMWCIAMLLVPMRLLSSLLMQVLVAILRIKETNLLEVADVAVHLLLLVLFVVVMSEGIEGAFLASAVSDGFIVAGFILLVLYFGGMPGKPDLALLGASLRYGMKSHLSNLMKLLNLRLDTFLITSLAVNGFQAIGIYSVAISLAELLLFIPASIRRSLFPMVASGGVADAHRLTSVAARHTLVLTVIVALAFSLIGPFLIPLVYGEAFASAIIPLLVLLPGVIMLAQAHIFSGYLNGCGKPGATMISALLSLIVTVILDVLLIPKFGVIGAALASSCAYSVECITAAAFFFRYSNLRCKDVFVFKKSDSRHYLDILSIPRKLMMFRT
jgi:O-antigen/teichoic acid export membrane protein